MGVFYLFFMQLVKIFVTILFPADRLGYEHEACMTTDAPPSVPSSIARLLIPADQPLPPATRLLVLIPDQDTDETKLARRIWGLASPRHLAVVYLSLTSDALTEARARRRLATLAAVTRDDWVNVQTQLLVGADWGRAVRAWWRPGDLVVCHAEQMVPDGWLGMWRRPLGQMLALTLKAPVYLLTGFYESLPIPTARRLNRIMSWSIPLLILIGFFLIQVQIEQQVTGWLRTTLLSASVALEFGLVGLWNRFSV